MANILVADDSNLVQKFVGRALESRGHEVVRADDGVEAVFKAGQEGFHLVLLDLNMPRMQGHQVARLLKDPESGFGAPIIILTSSTDPLDLYQVRPVSDYIAIKDADLGGLMEVVDQALAGSDGLSAILKNPLGTEAEVLDRVNRLMDRAYLETSVAHEISLLAQGATGFSEVAESVLEIAGDVMDAAGFLLTLGDTLHMSGESGQALYERAREQSLVPHLLNTLDNNKPVPNRGEAVFEPLKTRDLEGWLGVWGTFDNGELALFQKIAEAAAPVLENARLLERLEREATTDPLTGLANRRFFILRLEEEIARARRANDDLSLIMLDIDHFKSVNDTFGHPAGDHVLKTIARLLEESVRLEDIVGRLGGEEFAILLPNTGREGTLEVAERIRQGAPEMDVDLDRDITVSLGAATAARIDKADTLISRADDALYTAKHTGRNRVCWADEIPKN